jgi:lysozyme family protein
MASNNQKAALGGLGAISLILAAVFAVEGGYVNNANDPGGPTRHGVTEQVARQHGYTGDMRNFPRHCTYEGQVCAESIYFTDYIEKPGFLPIVKIDPAVGEEVIDTAVNMGPTRPSRYFQRAVNQVCNTRLSVDGRIGPMTVRAWGDCRANLGPRACLSMLDALDAQQEAEYDRLVRVNPKLRIFRRGWQNLRIGNVDRNRCSSVPEPPARKD